MHIQKLHERKRKPKSISCSYFYIILTLWCIQIRLIYYRSHSVTCDGQHFCHTPAASLRSSSEWHFASSEKLMSRSLSYMKRSLQAPFLPHRAQQCRSNAEGRGDRWNHRSQRHWTTNSSAVIKDAVVYTLAHLCFTCVTCTYSVCCCRYKRLYTSLIKPDVIRNNLQY